ncbi:hypothetical protein HPP92_022100 [Vanilla planifolia]|uniref:Protein kinase domain-containing protein n=1 Tax=Vanilla planifolia TaxID=51239 RepID=A0A835PWS6_VANPL|nr:hypothetical protein HPP92_022100 [Vanilla planifolia]
MGLMFPYLVCLLLHLLSFVCAAELRSTDAEALLALKGALDAGDHLPWRRETSGGLCTGWAGVKQCTNDGRVAKLVLEFLNLTGTLTAESLAPLDQLRVLSFKSNALMGTIPDLAVLRNLKSLYLSDNDFSGRIPASLAAIHRLKVIVLSNNHLSGHIPSTFAYLPRLYSFQLQSNQLTGRIPPLNQPTLRFFNVSGNYLSGEIPATRTLSRFNSSSFLNNLGLCGIQIQNPCPKNKIFPPSFSPKPSLSSSSSIVASSPLLKSNHQSSNRKRLVSIVAGSVAGFLVILTILALLLLLASRRSKAERRRKPTEMIGTREVTTTVSAAASPVNTGGGGGGGAGGKGVFSWEGQGLGTLVFVGGVGEMYSLEDLLKASAETLGRGTVGSTYKAVMESGYIVTVKRLRDPAAGSVGPEDFRRRMEELGRLRHPNLVPLRAFFHAKEERLLVYDYFPNGSIFSLIHGSRPSGSGKPLHWTSCLKIAEDVATGLLFLHQAGVAHGNLKSSNVLLGPDFESCLADYALLPSPVSTDDPFSSASSSSSSSLFYRAPECRHPSAAAFAPPSDVYSFGVLLLELLTGKTPFHDLVDRHGADIPAWVRAVREDEREKEGSTASADDASASGEDKLAALVGIATACVATEPSGRPVTGDLVRMIREVRAASVSSNSSGGGHSPARWSETVQSLAREYESEHLVFGERD